MQPLMCLCIVAERFSRERIDSFSAFVQFHCHGACAASKNQASTHPPFSQTAARYKILRAAIFSSPQSQEEPMLKLNRRVAALKPSATLAADQRAKEMRAAGIDVISLDAGEPDFDTPERIKEAARKALAAGKTKYTAVAGVPELKEAIRAKLKRENYLDYEPAEIIASAGCKQALSNVIAAMFDEGDEVIIPTPAWVSFSAMVDLSGAKPVQVRA